MTATDREPATTLWQMPRLRRDGRVVGGVASGIADEVGVEPVVIRAAFVVLSVAGGWGVVLYLGAWAAMTAYEQRTTEPAPTVRAAKGANETTRVVAIALIVLGLLLGLRLVDFGFADALVWPLALLALGTVLAWDRGVLGPSVESGGHWPVLARIAAGLGLAVAGIVLMLTANLDFAAAWQSLLVLGIVIVGLALLFAPWVWRLLTDLAEERRRRIRSEERSEVATHLHDSVLQTLALIQRNADDSQAMVSLARRQERELRDWLYGDRTASNAAERRFRRAVEQIAAEVEELHRVPVEVVVVGDRTVDGPIEPLLAATREALVNAAQHSGAAHVDLFAESGIGMVEVFVRDKGTGFDPEAVPHDRRGLAESIRARIERAGGTVTVDTTVGEGTEIALALPVADDDPPAEPEPEG